MTANKLILDLGCGKNKHPGAIGVDNVALDTVDIVHDLRSIPYPFASESVDEVILSHVIEHLDFGDIMHVLLETMRILKPSGCVLISVPHAFSVAAFTDPTHKTFFTFGSFHYFTSQHQFAYYKDIHSGWQIERLWASANLFNNQFQKDGWLQTSLNSFASRALRYIIRRSKSLTLPELIIKVFPFWLVSIHVRLVKV